MRNVFQFAKIGVEKYLESLVKYKLSRSSPTIIGVTGAFGKTSTKEAIYEVLKTKWSAYRNPKSLNTEIGMLLAILQQPSGFRSPFKWASILASAAKNALTGEKYNFLVLEYGADKPGDIEHLVKIVKPHIGVMTHVARVHQAEGQFKNIEEVFKEKKKLVTNLDKSGIAILNAEDSHINKLKNLNAKTFWFNSHEGIYATDVKNTHTGISAQIHFGGKSFHAQFSVPGTYHINVFLPALMIGVLNGISIKDGIAALEKFKLPPGRMSIIRGIHGSTILDSTYNASPLAVTEALNLLKEFPGERKIAVIGNMNELGEYTQEAHREIAKPIGNWLDILITVGEYAHLTAQQALKDGFPESRIRILQDANQAGDALTKFGLKKGDVVLLKGSQNRVRLERAVKMIMANPSEAHNVLCRQEREWSHI